MWHFYSGKCVGINDDMLPKKWGLTNIYRSGSQLGESPINIHPSMSTIENGHTRCHPKHRPPGIIGKYVGAFLVVTMTGWEEAHTPFGLHRAGLLTSLYYARQSCLTKCYHVFNKKHLLYGVQMDKLKPFAMEKDSVCEHGYHKFSTRSWITNNDRKLYLHK